MGCWGVGFQVLAQSKTEHSQGIVHGGSFEGIAATIAVNCAFVPQSYVESENGEPRTINAFVYAVQTSLQEDQPWVYSYRTAGRDLDHRVADCTTPAGTGKIA